MSIYYVGSSFMPEDIVRALGYLMLGTRFKRIGERLQADATRIAEGHGAAVQSGQYPFLLALDRLGPLTIGEVAEAVGITQPGATRAIAQLVKIGMVKARPGRNDQRQRIVSLTAKGQGQVDFGRQELWPKVEAAVADLCDPLSGSLLDQLAALEDGLTNRPLEQRIKSK
jgi:DNA-binding MarR family transcriptional regulator